MNYPHLATRLYNVPLLLTPGKAEIIEQVFRAHQEGRPMLLAPQLASAEELAPRRELLAPGTMRTEAGYLRTAEGVALIQVMGTLVQRGSNMDAMSGMTGYNKVAAQLQSAMDDPRVGGVLLEIDSPGGEANGAFDLAAKIRAAGKKKPVWASANEQAFSAGYLIASAAERVSVPESGRVGSVGVVAMHLDQSQRDAKQGLSYTPIYAGARKVDFNSHAPLSTEAMNAAQEEVDHIYDMFVSAVSSGRGISEQAVRDTEAGLFGAKVAQKLSLVNSVESFDATLEALTKEAQQVRTTGTRTIVASRLDAEAIDLEADDGHGEVQLIEEQMMATGAVENFTAAQMAEAQTNAGKAAMQTERQRIAAIMNCEAAKGKTALASHLALETDLTLAQAEGMLAKAATEATAQPANLLAAAMGKVPNPNVGADAVAADAVAAADDRPARRLATLDEIYGARSQASQPVK